MAPKVPTKHMKKCTPEFLILSAVKLSSCGLVAFMNMNTYILTGGTNFKIFLKEIYPVDLDSCYIFTKNMLNMKLKIMLIVLMEFAYIRHSSTFSRFGEYLAI